MAKRELKGKYGEVKPERVFEAGKETFEALGFEIFKTRPFAFLIQAKKPGHSGVINANLIANAFSKEFNITVNGENESQDDVDSLANEILSSVEENIR
jgi:hypothetical protein